MITGEEKPDAGTFNVGETVQVSLGIRFFFTCERRRTILKGKIFLTLTFDANDTPLRKLLLFAFAVYVR